MSVHGTCDPRFEPVREVFERNFTELQELGASVCVTHRGETVVDLWGGVADETTGALWTEDTVNVVMSCSKGAGALCMHLLMDRGVLDLDAPVASYWPEFAKNGKESITLRMVLSHSAGVPHVQTPIPPDGLADHELMVRAIEDQAPFWHPGTRHGYHGLAIGYIQGELVRRITGRTLGTYFAEEVAGPLALDFWIGLPEEHEPRVAPSTPYTGSEGSPAVDKLIDDPDSVTAALFLNLGNWSGLWDTRQFHAAEIPAGGGITNGRGLAHMYAPLANGGAHRGVRLLPASSIDAMRLPQAHGHDEVLQVTTSYTLGFSKSSPNERRGDNISAIIGESAFGAPGAGGQLGFADPAHHLSFGYTMTRHGAGTALNRRGQDLVDAVYGALGTPVRTPECWVNHTS